MNTEQVDWRMNFEELQKKVRNFILSHQDYDFPTDLIKMVLTKEDLGA
jgi:hypothetical protein